MKRTSINFIYLSVLFFCLLSNGQNKGDIRDYYNFFDDIIGIENSDLHYGVLYKERHRVKSKKTKFFPEPDFLLGSVVFNGQPYFAVNLKYNVYDDELLMQVDKQFGGDILQLYKDQIDRFTIDKHRFIKIDSEQLKEGFYEVAMEETFFSLLKKHRKSLKQLLAKKLVFYEFENEDEDYFLFFQNTYHSIGKISDLSSIFPKYQAELSAFNQNQDTDLTFDNRLVVLLEYLSTLFPREYDKMLEN